MATNKGFITDQNGNKLLPITRAELILDSKGYVALHSDEFLAGNGLPGLMTAAEKEMLSGGGTGQGISDIYNKLQYINSGLKINGTVLNFYTETSGTLTQTPINISSAGDNKIDITLNGNSVNLGLSAIHTSETSASQILKSITIDKYGRVKAVSGSALTNSEIPEELSGKTIKDSTLSNCVTSTEDIGSDNKSVANRAYVERRIQEVTNLATGALKFGGPLSSTNAAVTAATEDTYKNQYFKVTGSYIISSEYIYFAEEEVVKNITVKPGDTLIRHPEEEKLVYIPSADETVTRLTVTEEGSASDALSNVLGDITLQFSSLFEVSNPRGNVAAISIPKANSLQDGYLSKSDYILFSSYADSLAVTYESLVATSGNAVYPIGTLTVGSNPYTIYGLNNVSKLELTNGATSAYNPILKFTENGSVDLSLTFKNGGGISVLKNGNDIEFKAANEVVTGSESYLEITDGYKFAVKIGSVSNGQLTEGLTKYSDFNAFKNQVIGSTTSFTIINNSLKDTTQTYYYGSTALKAVVAPEGFII